MIRRGRELNPNNNNIIMLILHFLSFALYEYFFYYYFYLWYFLFLFFVLFLFFCFLFYFGDNNFDTIIILHMQYIIDKIIKIYTTLDIQLTRFIESCFFCNCRQPYPNGSCIVLSHIYNI